MPDVELTIRVPALLAARLAADAGTANVSVEQHAVRVLLGDVLRTDAERRTAWLAAHPNAQAAEQRDAVLDEIERDVARLVDDGLDPADAAATARRLIEQYDLTRSPGYLDPGNRAIPMTTERHLAILSATMRADHDQLIAEIEASAAKAGQAGDESARRRYLDRVERLRALRLP